MIVRIVAEEDTWNKNLLVIRKKPDRVIPMKNPIKTVGSQLFNVPNTDEGRFFIQLARKFLNGNRVLAPRGRASDRKKAYARIGNKAAQYSSSYASKSHVPNKGAEWLAVYVRNKKQRPVLVPPVTAPVAAPEPRWNYQK